MPTPFEYLQSLNRLVHEPARLAILVALSPCDKAGVDKVRAGIRQLKPLRTT